MKIIKRRPFDEFFDPREKIFDHTPAFSQYSFPKSIVIRIHSSIKQNLNFRLFVIANDPPADEVKRKVFWLICPAMDQEGLVFVLVIHVDLACFQHEIYLKDDQI